MPIDETGNHTLEVLLLLGFECPQDAWGEDENDPPLRERIRAALDLDFKVRDLADSLPSGEYYAVGVLVKTLAEVQTAVPRMPQLKALLKSDFEPQLYIVRPDEEDGSFALEVLIVDDVDQEEV
jgi:hypothetical protein